MKKALFAITAILILVFLVGCKLEEKQQKIQEQTYSEASTGGSHSGSGGGSKGSSQQQTTAEEQKPNEEKSGLDYWLDKTNFEEVPEPRIFLFTDKPKISSDTKLTEYNLKYGYFYRPSYQDFRKVLTSYDYDKEEITRDGITIIVLIANDNNKRGSPRPASDVSKLMEDEFHGVGDKLAVDTGSNTGSSSPSNGY